MYSHNLLTG